MMELVVALGFATLTIGSIIIQTHLGRIATALEKLNRSFDDE